MKKISRSDIWSGIILVLAVFIAYLPALGGGFIWDDDSYITQNPTLRSPHGFWQIWFQIDAVPRSQYYPLVYSVFWLEFHLWGLHPLGYHLVNILLHAFGSLLLWRVLARVQVPGAWLAAMLFGLHPVHVESVAWATECKNVLSAVFYFSAALLYLRYAETCEAGPANRRQWQWYGGALVLFAAALLSKTVTCSLPAALLLLTWWKKGRISWKATLPLLPFFVIGAGMGLLTGWIEKHQVGAQGADWSFSFADRCLIAGRALWFYAAKLLWPAHLTFMYPRWEISASAWWQWMFPSGMLAMIISLWLVRKRIGRGPLVALLFFAGTLFPALGFADVYPMRYSFVADHFQYLASVGLLALAAAGLSRLPLRITMVLVVALGVLTWRQTEIYRSLETLWRDTLAKNPACWMAQSNLGSVLLAQGNLAEAETHFRAALQLKPDSEDIHYNYGNMLGRAGRPDEAVTQFRQALQLNPTDAQAYHDLGIALYQEHRLDEAIACFRRALCYQPDYADAHYNLGNALVLEYKFDEAAREYREALRLEPDSVDIKNRLRALGVPTN